MEEKKLELYKKLSNDNALSYYHTPLKTLLLIIDDKIDNDIFYINMDKDTFNNQYQIHLQKNNVSIKNIELKNAFDTNVIFNKYESFLDKVIYIIKGFE